MCRFSGCVNIAAREGRAALVTSYGVFKYICNVQGVPIKSGLLGKIQGVSIEIIYRVCQYCC